VSQALRKNRRLKLDPESYKDLRHQVLRRDGWKCQSCGSMANLEVHHLKFRSHSGADSDHNLITLCFKCHSEVHERGAELAQHSGNGCLE
jgi:5-methylcytosine-specific restriction endonuclease McrA